MGGSAESRWRAVGYIAAAGDDQVLCGATLIAPNVAVTAAHCLYRSRELPLDFGVGEVEDGERTAIRSYTVHPDAQLEAEGSIDLVHSLLLYDLAYLILDQPVEGDGDEGHAAVGSGADGAPVLIGIYVGSVTQAFSDCRKYLQYLNGYEATFGYLDFYREGIAAGAAALDADP